MSMGCKGCPYLYRTSQEDIICSHLKIALRDPAIYMNEDAAFLRLWNLCKCELKEGIMIKLSEMEG